MDEPSEKEVRLQVGPYSGKTLTVNFEPTEMSYELAAGETGLVEIGHTPDALVVGAWAESEISVWTKDGSRLFV
ncbi:MAG: hypothetical protein QOI21_2523 [Actinomycetota bacterium]|jgi:hypothetical protein|nr:hypothetical protein [Actinomycetota bacterium]